MRCLGSLLAAQTSNHATTDSHADTNGSRRPTTLDLTRSSVTNSSSKSAKKVSSVSWHPPRPLFLGVVPFSVNSLQSRGSLACLLFRLRASLVPEKKESPQPVRILHTAETALSLPTQEDSFQRDDTKLTHPSSLLSATLLPSATGGPSRPRRPNAVAASTPAGAALPSASVGRHARQHTAPRGGG